MSNELIISKKFTPAQLALIKRTVARGASDDELLMFSGVCNKTGLNPFLKEIYFIKYKDESAIIMTGRDGFLSIAQKSGGFEGLQSAAVYENDEFEIDYNKMEIFHKAKHKDRGILIGAWAKTYRKGCHPNIAWVDFQTYNRGFNLWKTNPAAMIIKCAESISLKKMFGISGLVSMEEMGEEAKKEVTIDIDTEKAINDILKKIEILPKEKYLESLQKLLDIPPVPLTNELTDKISALIASLQGEKPKDVPVDTKEEKPLKNENK